MGELRDDAIKLITGNDGSEKEPDDFKSTLQNAIKKEIITKSDGTMLINARDNSDKLGNSIDKKQVDAVKKIKDDELYDSAEEELEATKKKEEKKRERERKRKQRELDLARNQEEHKISQNKDIEKEREE